MKTVWNSIYELKPVKNESRYNKKRYGSSTDNVKKYKNKSTRIKYSKTVFNKLLDIINNKNSYTEWELDFCKSLLKYKTYTAKQKPFLILLLNKKI